MDLAVKCLLGVVNACNNQALGTFMSCEENIESLKNQMKILSRTKNLIERRTKEAKKKGKEVITEVEEWLDEIRALEHDTKVLDSEYNSMFKILDTWSPFVWHQYHLSKNAKKLLKLADSLGKSGNFPEVASEPSSTCFIERPGGTGVGMERVLKQIQLYMEDDEVAVIAICGMGKIGKTNILEKFNNELIPKSIEDMKWVNMEDFPNVQDMQKFLIQNLGLSWTENKSCKDHAAYLLKYLKDKRFLLIFDNVWQPLDFRAIGIPVRKSKGGKIILTTRSLDICGQMQAKVINVKRLNWKNAWSLFLENAGETARMRIARYQATIGKIAEGLMIKCGGLPEAIIKIGRAVATKENIDQWEHLLKLLDTAPWKVTGMQELLSELKLSYDKLDPKSKACLLYSSLYPEGFSIKKQWIIDYCIGEGLINSYDEGEDKLGELKNASLLETGDSEESIEMHPVVRAMTLWIACECGQSENKWLVQAGKKIKEAPIAESWSGAQRISLMRNNIENLSEVPDCPNLETLLLQGNHKLERIHNDFFLYMPKLRVLDLSHTGIRHLPAGIAKLVSLQYLDVCDTAISSLPEELGALVNLRFLLLAFMPNLRTIPSGVFAKLVELQVLYMHGSYRKWKVATAETGVDFEELNNLKRLMALGITVENIETLEKLSESYRLASCTRKTSINDCKKLKCVGKDSIWGGFKDVRRLDIVNCYDLEEVIIDGKYLQKLQHLKLVKLQNMKIIWSQGCFDNLSKLVIEKCDNIESLIYCNNEVSQVENNYDEEEQLNIIDAFPNLKELYLVHLPRLESLCSGTRSLALPSLQVLYVKDCQNLKKLNMAAGQLQVICSTESWWSSVESLDFDIKTLFHYKLEDV